MWVLEGFLSQEFTDLSVSWIFSSHVYEWPAKLKNQKAADAKHSLWEQQFREVFGEANRNSELCFTMSLTWSSEDTDISLGRTVSKTWKQETCINASYWAALDGLRGMSPTHGLTFMVTLWLYWHPSIMLSENELGLLEVAVWPATLQSTEKSIDACNLIKTWQ